MATLLGDDIRKETSVTVLPGLLDKPGILDKGSPIIVDGLIPDYQILESIDNAYIAYAVDQTGASFAQCTRLSPVFVTTCLSSVRSKESRMYTGPSKI